MAALLQAVVGGLPVWAYRWAEAPLHALEIVAPVHLRTALALGGSVRGRLSPRRY